MFSRSETAMTRANYSSSLVIQQTLFGVDGGSVFARDRMESIEIVVKIIAIVFSSVGALIAAADLPAKILTTANSLLVACIVIALGLLLFMKASTGLIREIQIDNKQKSLLLGTRDSSGRFKACRTYSFDDLVSAYIRRSRNKDSTVTLHITTRTDRLPIGILKGMESDLLPVLNYLVEQRSIANVGLGHRRTTATKEIFRTEFV